MDMDMDMEHGTWDMDMGTRTWDMDMSMTCYMHMHLSTRACDIFGCSVCDMDRT